MSNDSRQNQPSEQSTIEKSSEKSLEAFKAELNNISSLIQTLEKNPQDSDLRAQISTRLTNAVSTAVTSHISLPDCERMMQNYGIHTYWEDMKAGKTTSTDKDKDLSQAQKHQEQQAVLTAQQIAQIQMQAAKDYNDFWGDHNNIDYAHATAAEREKWMQDELKKMPQWAQELGKIAKTKPFNEAKVELQEQARQKLKDIEEKKKEMLAIINNPNATKEEREQALLHYQLLQQEQQNIENFQQDVANAKDSNGLLIVTAHLGEVSKQTGKIATDTLTHKSQKEKSEDNKTITVADDIERKQATSFNQLSSQKIQEQTRQKLKNIEEKEKEMLAVINNPNVTEEEREQALLHYKLLQQEQQNVENFQRDVANAKDSNGFIAVTAYLGEASNQTGKIATQGLTHKSQEETSETNRTLHIADNRERTQATSFAQASFKEDSGLTINSEGTATSFTNAQTSNSKSTPDAQNMGTLLSALKDIPQEVKNENIVMSSTGKNENTPNTSDKPKEVSLAAVLKDMNTPQPPNIPNQTTSEEKVAQPTSEQQVAQTTSTVSTKHAKSLSDLNLPPLTVFPISGSNPKTLGVTSNGNPKVLASVNVTSNDNSTVSAPGVTSKDNTKTPVVTSNDNSTVPAPAVAKAPATPEEKSTSLSAALAQAEFKLPILPMQNTMC